MTLIVLQNLPQKQTVSQAKAVSLNRRRRTLVMGKV